MITIDSLSMTNATHRDLLALKEAGQKIYVGTPKGIIGEGGPCSNCDSTGNIIATIVLAGPLKSPSGSGLSNIGGKWYATKTHSYPCPLCSSTEDHPTIIGGLKEDSGLVGDEVNWRLDFLEGKPGKNIALEIGRGLLTKLPNPDGIYTFFGDYGVGKTGVLKSVVAAAVAMGVKARYVNMADVLRKMRAGFNGGEPEGDVLDGLMRYKLLAIDEIEKVSTTDWAKESMFSLFDGRYNERKTSATLFATNLSPDLMPPEFGYLKSRMEDGIRCPVGGVSLRGQ